MLPIYPVLFTIHQKIGKYDEIVEEFKNSGRNTKVTRITIMEPEIARQPVATVTGLYRGKFGGLEPLTVDKPLTRDEVRRNPIFYELDLHPEQGDENLIIDVIYDNLSPMRLQDLYRGTDIPRGVRSGRTGLTFLPMRRCTTSMAAGFTRERQDPHGPDPDGRRKFAQMGRVRDFSLANGGYTSPVFEIRIAEYPDVRE